MKKIYLLFFLLLALSNFAEAQIFEKAKKLLGDKGSFSKQEAAEALKEAFIQGTGKGVDLLARVDGYYGNPEIKIPFPEGAENIAQKLREFGLGKQIDRTVEALNRAAEDAASGAKDIFIAAIKGLTIAEAVNIVKGKQDAGTRFLEKQTNNELNNKFSPVIEASLNKVGATKYWSEIMTRYNQIPFIKKVETDLTAYVTQKAIDGLFVMIAKEELNIRKNPVARTTALLKKVFK